MDELSATHQTDEVDLIDILWRQDIDLGAERGVFDGRLRRREENKKKAEEEEKKRRDRQSKRERIVIKRQNLDEETGEFMPLLRPLDAPIQVSQNVDKSLRFDSCVQLSADTHSTREVPPLSRVFSGNASPSGNLPLCPVTKNPLLSALVLSQKPPAEEQVLDELLQLPELQGYLDLLESNVYDVSSPPPVDTEENYREHVPAFEFQNDIMVSHAYTDPVKPTQTHPDALISANSPDNLSQRSLTPPELCLNLHTLTFTDSALSENTTAPAFSDFVHLEHTHILSHPELAGEDPSHPCTDLLNNPLPVSFNSPESHVSLDVTKSFYGEESLSCDQFDAADIFCSQSASTELFPPALLSEASPSHTLAEISSERPAPRPRPNTPPKECVTDVQPATESQAGAVHRRKSRLFRDEQRATALALPVSIDDIINLPVDSFNEVMSSEELNEAQITLIRDIRRRGKNKMAAQSCRKRKLDSLSSLEEEVEKLREESEREIRERERNEKALHEAKDQLRKLYSQVFSCLRDEEGKPFNPKEYKLQHSTDGRVYLVPHAAPTLTQ